MYLIVGLGNPGREYENTRHNVGFQVLDLLADRYKISLSRIKFKSVYGEGSINGEKVILAKPQTFMNASGESVAEITRFYKIPNEKVLVIYDDMSLDVGRLRIRAKGSAGGHNGIKNIIAHLSSEDFPRIKVGIGKPEGGWISHVMGNFSKEEQEKLAEVYKTVIHAVETIIAKGTEEAMNKYNSFKI
ncbi:MAG: aminoacyl-tRNA hydrolase [Clostridiales bacterium]|uniref:aminoacyl-tRNA hydrolase n=1 Tax=Clostridium sp. N3C TaxID=1776758 RepID=UPI00092E0ACE|nr:aminoacyl-tRNA hydrolase [Clostridium sp. N3C]NLZ48352.1 aminoacyl-tRNA hydrolase [Clostridiales bacterium]SCN23117.1 Peptidyl-tRNA hydrolase [Clostridium sp. N3C]